MEGPLDGVARRLVQRDPDGRFRVGAPRRRRAQVEELPHRHLQLQAGQEVVRFGRHVRKQAIGMKQSEVAEHDCRRRAELIRVAGPFSPAVHFRKADMQRRRSTTKRRGIHHVVVDQRRQMDQLEGRARVDDQR